MNRSVTVNGRQTEITLTASQSNKHSGHEYTMSSIKHVQAVCILWSLSDSSLRGDGCSIDAEIQGESAEACTASS